jgi:hypothetical protein
MINARDIENFFVNGNTVGNAMNDIIDLDKAKETLDKDKEAGLESMEILTWCMARASRTYLKFEENQKSLSGLAKEIPAPVAFAGAGMFSMFRVGYYLGRAEEAGKRALGDTE